MVAPALACGARSSAVSFAFWPFSCAASSGGAALQSRPRPSSALFTFSCSAARRSATNGFICCSCSRRLVLLARPSRSRQNSIW